MLDGVDEAPGLRIDQSLLPQQMSPDLRLVISIRSGADGKPEAPTGPVDSSSLPFAEPLILNPIDRTGVRAIVDTLRYPPPDNERDAFADRLFELAQGDPLLVGYYCELLDEAAEQNRGKRSGMDPLRDLEPGLQPLVDRELRPHLGEQLPKRAVDASFGVLAVAVAPLPLSDFIGTLELLGCPEQTALRAQTAISRFVLFASGQLFFRHPRLAEFVRDERPDGEKLLSRAGTALLNFQRAAADGLADGSSKVPSPYLMRYHARHLMMANSMVTADWSRIVSKGWLRVRLETENGGRIGVADDAHAVLQQMSKVNLSRDPAAVASCLRASLVLSSLRANDVITSPGLLSLAHRHGLVSMEEVEAAAISQKAGDRAETLALLAAAEPEPLTRSRLRDLALAASAQAQQDSGFSGNAVIKALTPIFDRSQVIEIAKDLAIAATHSVSKDLALFLISEADPNQLTDLVKILGPKLYSFHRTEFFLAPNARRGQHARSFWPKH